MTRILVFAHNHPAFHPGGTEIFAHDLFHAYKRAGCDAFFLGATNTLHREPHPGTGFQAVGPAGDEAVFWAGHFDRFMMSQTDLHGVVPDLAEFLLAYRPDVVHLHHLLLVGVEFPALIRRVLPDTRILMTLHDYYAICPNDGLMVGADGQRYLSTGPDGARTRAPGVTAEQMLLRDLHIRTHLAAIDQFIAPSEFLKARYVDWGLPAERIAVIRNGLPVVGRVPPRRTDGPRNVFGYFGNLNPWKGVTTLLDACRILDQDGVDYRLRLHGAALYQDEAFVQALEGRLAEASRRVVRLGAYRRAEVPDLMASVDWAVVPSTWWENAPLTIAEAQAHHRPVVTSNIGGMAELVTDGANGLTVRPGDQEALADAMRRCVEEPELWERCAAAAAPPPSIDWVALRHLALLNRLADGLAPLAA